MNNNHGFTLLEVIVAMTICMLGLAAFYQTLSSGILVTDRATREGHASIFADNMVTELGRLRELRDGRTTGTLADGQAWSLQIETKTPRDNGEGPTVIQSVLVDLEVGSRPYRFNTLLLILP